MHNQQNININVKTPCLVLFASIGLLLVLHLAGTAWLVSQDYELDRWSWIFNFGYENNLPSLFSFALLLGNGLCLFLVGHTVRSTGEKYALHWMLLGLIFLFLAIDEALALHEVLGEYLQAALNTRGFLYFAWVLPYTLFVLLLAVTYFRFMLSLPDITRTRFLISAGVYLTGAVGMELLESSIYETCAEPCHLDMLLVTIEESLEMIGAVLFLRAQLLFLAQRQCTLELVTHRQHSD